MRYVVLRHEGFGDPHFDLMFQSSPGSALMTWRATDWPLAAGDVLTRIGDHRRDYLDYEGPISNDRGNVRRIVAGECEVTSSADLVSLQLRVPDPVLIVLRLDRDQAWTVVEVQP